MIAPEPSNNDQSDSDSDWDDDDDFGAKKINIKIKPITQVTPSKISASVDELRATVGTWKSLANINLVKPNSRRHHRSTVQLNDLKTSNDKPITRNVTTSVLLPREMNFMSQSLAPNGQPTIQNVTTSILSTDGYNLLEGNLNSLISPFQELAEEANSKIHYTNDLENSNKLPLFNALLESQIGTLNLPIQNLSVNLNHIRNKDERVNRLPVAFSVQECININIVKGLESESHFVVEGRIKMAVPIDILNVKYPSELCFDMKTRLIFDDMAMNTRFVRESNSEYHEDDVNRPKRYVIDMLAVQSYAQQQHQNNGRYILTPDLLKYFKRSQLVDSSTGPIYPLIFDANWLCDLDVTKVRVNFGPWDSFLHSNELSMSDIVNLKITTCVNGGVQSYQSKPDANWSIVDSRLTWSLSSLEELEKHSSPNGIISCLARFDINDGPSIPSDVDLQFKIIGKTIAGVNISVESENYKLTKLKLETRTGIYKCQPACI